MAAADPGKTLPADRVDLIDKNNTPLAAGFGSALGLVEKVAHAAGPHADKHLDKVGAADTEKRDLSLTRDCFSQERFSAPRRADQDYALGNSSTQFLKSLRFF